MPTPYCIGKESKPPPESGACADRTQWPAGVKLVWLILSKFIAFDPFTLNLLYCIDFLANCQELFLLRHLGC